MSNQSAHSDTAEMAAAAATTTSAGAESNNNNNNTATSNGPREEHEASTQGSRTEAPSSQAPAETRKHDETTRYAEEEENEFTNGVGQQLSNEEVNAMEQDMLIGVVGNDVKNIILQVLSPYFDDDGTAGAAGGAGAAGVGDGHDMEEEDTAQRYDHTKSRLWIQLICDGIMERLIAMSKPYKFVVHCMVMRKCGAGMHVCSSCYFKQTDGWISHAHDLSAHIYAVVTVYWSII